MRDPNKLRILGYTKDPSVVENHNMFKTRLEDKTKLGVLIGLFPANNQVHRTLMSDDVFAADLLGYQRDSENFVVKSEKAAYQLAIDLLNDPERPEGFMAIDQASIAVITAWSQGADKGLDIK